MQQRLNSGAGGAEGQALAQQLADAVDAQMAKLEQYRQARLRALAGMQQESA